MMQVLSFSSLWFLAGHLFYSESVSSNEEWKYGCEDQNEITSKLLQLSLIIFI